MIVILANTQQYYDLKWLKFTFLIKFSNRNNWSCYLTESTPHWDWLKLEKSSTRPKLEFRTIPKITNRLPFNTKNSFSNRLSHFKSAHSESCYENSWFYPNKKFPWLSIIWKYSIMISFQFRIKWPGCFTHVKHAVFQLVLKLIYFKLPLYNLSMDNSINYNTNLIVINRWNIPR